MKNLLLLLPLALLAAPPATAASEASTRADAAVPLRLVEARPTSDSLHERLQAIRRQHAAARVPDLLSETQRRRRELSRPLQSDCLGSLHRRQRLGDRTLPSADDRRLGSEMRRQLLAGRPVQALLRRR